MKTLLTTFALVLLTSCGALPLRPVSAAVPPPITGPDIFLTTKPPEKLPSELDQWRYEYKEQPGESCYGMAWDVMRACRARQDVI